VVWGLGGSGFAVLSLSDSEAARLTVTTDDDEMLVLRECVRRCFAGCSGCCSGSAALLVCIFMFLLAWASVGAGTMGSCLRTNDTLMQRGMQACCRCRNALFGQAMMRESAGRRGRCRAASAVYRRVVPTEVARKTPRPLGDLRASFDTCDAAKGTRPARGWWSFPWALGLF
jgi:hypothetical protein